MFHGLSFIWVCPEVIKSVRLGGDWGMKNVSFTCNAPSLTLQRNACPLDNGAIISHQTSASTSAAREEGGAMMAGLREANDAAMSFISGRICDEEDKGAGAVLTKAWEGSDKRRGGGDRPRCRPPVPRSPPGHWRHGQAGPAPCLPTARDVATCWHCGIPSSRWQAV